MRPNILARKFVHQRDYIFLVGDDTQELEWFIADVLIKMGDLFEDEHNISRPIYLFIIASAQEGSGAFVNCPTWVNLNLFT